jgi:chromosome segregation ATPase
LRKIDPTPTPEQLRTREEEAAKRKEADRAVAEAKRRDMALLNTYSSDHEIDVARDRNIEPIRGRIKSAQERIDALDKRLAQLDEEMEFYKAGKRKTKNSTDAPPPMLVADRERAQKEREGLLAGIASNEKEIVAVRERYESDKRRFAELKGSPSLRAAAQAPNKEPTVAATMVPGAAGVAWCGSKMYECQAGQQYTCRSGTRSYTVNCAVERK